MNGLLGRIREARDACVPEAAPQANGIAPDRLLEPVQAWVLEQHPALARAARADSAARQRLQQAVAGWLVRQGVAPSRVQAEMAAARLVADLVGLGPLEQLLDDPEVTEIMVNAPDEVWVERSGRLERAELGFSDEAHVLQLVQRAIAPLGRRLDYTQPYVDARLPDGSRLHAIIPPLAVRAPVVTIRRFARAPLGPDDLVRAGSASPELVDFLRGCVEGRANILVSGATATGKTTLLNVLAGFAGPDERIITIEDAAELRLGHAHVVALEARMPGPDGQGGVAVRELLRNALRMRPDRLVIGEVRGAEALDLLHALNTGHDGSMGTIHANGPEDALDRFENMVLLAGESLPHGVLRAQVAAAVDVVVHLARDADGRRYIAHVAGVGVRGGRRQLQEAFRAEGPGRFAGPLAPVPRRRVAAR